MLEKKNWLLTFIQKFREILETEEYRGYREFFQAFCKDLYPYLSVELLEFYDKQGNHVRNEISLFSSDYGDKVEIIKKKIHFGKFFLLVSFIVQMSLLNYTKKQTIKA